MEGELRSSPTGWGDGPFGNPFVLEEMGIEMEVLAKYKEWLYRGTEVVNGYDPKEYRRKAINELPGFTNGACHCEPKACHGEISEEMA